MNFYLGILAFSSYGLFVFVLFVFNTVMKDPNMWGTVAEWFGAAGTIAAVIVALFKEQILQHLYRPILKASIKNGQPDTRKTDTIHTGNPMYSIRFRVDNIGRSRAEDIEVVLNKLYRKSGGNFEIVQSFAPMNLKWSNSQPNTVTTVLKGMSPTMGRHCDLALIAYHQPGNLIFRTEIDPTGNWNIQGPGEYMICLRIGAANCRPIDFNLFIKYSGQWKNEEEEMLGKELVISTTDVAFDVGQG